MDAGAQVDELQAAAEQLVRLADDLQGLRTALGPLVARLARASGQPAARRACDRAGDELVPAVDRLGRATRRLGDDAAGQVWMFRAADGGR